MAEFINKGILFDTVWDYSEYKKSISTKAVLHLINDAPKIDAVEVVRCENCKHHFMFACTRHKGNHFLVKDNDFCSYGEKKEGNSNESI